MWAWIGLGAAFVGFAVTLLLVRRLDRATEPYEDPYDWQ